MSIRPSLLWKDPDRGWRSLNHPNFPAALWDFVRTRAGFVYAMSMTSIEDEISGWIKIGHTKNDPFLRTRQLGHAGSLHVFDVLLAYPFANRFWAEKKIHEMAKEVRGRGELFNTDLETVKHCLETCQSLERETLSRYVDYDLLVAGADKEVWLSTGVDMEKWITNSM